ncbi:hypothetical protein OPV22_023179 [Ensete ventricosum]|uniref:Uncharacterized protein n=1 Tax=Ensete ventricosum TaxID=4639 RepID=A0AAV8QUS1_ENSVE|nr:hypothetical protein OPV22_023179 [Ensete ventricosum]
MEAGKAKQQRERRTSNGVIIQVYEEAPPPRPGANRPIQRPSRLRAPSSLAYDRRQMLLAYTQQLRRCHEQQTQRCCKIVPRPSWGQWKATFLRNHGGCDSWEKRRFPAHRSQRTPTSSSSFSFSSPDLLCRAHAVVERHISLKILDRRGILAVLRKLKEFGA